jgi:hypothetical protein
MSAGVLEPAVTAHISSCDLKIIHSSVYKILISSNKLKIMSEVAHDNWKGLKLFTCFIKFDEGKEPYLFWGH